MNAAVDRSNARLDALGEPLSICSETILDIEREELAATILAVVAGERERCARIAESHGIQIAAAIRQLEEPTDVH